MARAGALLPRLHTSRQFYALPRYFLQLLIVTKQTLSCAFQKAFHLWAGL